jgi:hypothetical protein
MPKTSYTTSQQKQLRTDFEPVAAQYRHFKHWKTGLSFGFMACLALFFCIDFLPSNLTFIWLFSFLALFVLFWLVTIVLSLRMNALFMCPGCIYPLKELHTYCPECGHAGLVPAVSHWLSTTPAHCTACSKDLVITSGKDGGSRQYTIRACSHCGLYLDDEGL